ncbi:MAG: hypothetical protein K8F58_11845, partial [Bauldia sp.]|nr:hypothetical protein [Bauldia sp.]
TYGAATGMNIRSALSPRRNQASTGPRRKARNLRNPLDGIVAGGRLVVAAAAAALIWAVVSAADLEQDDGT